MTDIVIAQATQLAKTLGVEGNAKELVDTLKATAFRGQVSDAQMAALLLVANKHGLSPWTKEIYAFPDRQNGIVPVVGVDGWSRIINENPAFDGMEFEQTDDSCTCRIYRKDRSHPITVTEYMDECRRDNSTAWESHPRRMLRHKTLIQCARLAFGFSGIFDQDEADRIVEATSAEPNRAPRAAAQPQPAEKPAYPDAQFAENFPKWADMIASGRKTAEQIVAIVGSKYLLSVEQVERIRDMEVQGDD